MSEIENPPAFPRAIAASPSGDIHEGWDGMSLRDWFAGQAVGRMIDKSEDRNGCWDPAAVAVGCYAIADAMLAWRASQKQEG